MKIKLSLLFLFFNVCIIGQISKTDSLLTALKIAHTDTGKINTLNSLAAELISNNPDTSIYWANKALGLAKKNNFTFGIAESYASIGLANYYLGKNDEALFALKIADSACIKSYNATMANRQQKLLGKINNAFGAVYLNIGNSDLAKLYFEKYLHISEKLKFTKGIANARINISVIEQSRTNYPEALQNLFAALKTVEQLNEPKFITIVYNNIAAIYMDMNENSKALEYLNKTLPIAQASNQLNVVSVCYYNRGLIYFQQNKLELALTNALEAIKTAKEINNAKNLRDAFDLIGKIYAKQGKYTEALEKQFEGFNIAEKSQSPNGMVVSLNGISKTYYLNKNTTKAIYFAEKGLQLAIKNNIKTSLQESAENLELYYTDIKNYKKALEMKTLAVNTRDSTLSEKNQKSIISQELKYNYQKQALADSLKYDNDKKIQLFETQTNLKTQRNKQIALSIGLVLAIIVGVILYNRFKVTQKQKIFIETQSKKLEIAHEQLEEKSKEIQDSILYSKEIQNVFLKSITAAENYFNDVVLMYKPKATVSGDFYWYQEKKEHLIIVVGDCTGHGVPGAIISVLAIQSLEKVINQLTNFENLHQLNDLMNKEFNTYNKKESYVSIGLDFSVLCIDKTKHKLYLSGSGGSIIVKNNEQKITNHKFESINIGGMAPMVYSPSTIFYPIKQLSSVFLYTDGIVDQKGETTGKKFGTKQLTELLENLNTNDATLAFQKIETTLNSWQGKATQVDDMTLLGIQFNHLV